jgi:predicted lipid-binding transport protein (Tim44 family)
MIALPEGSMALALGTGLSLAALMLVLSPLLGGAEGTVAATDAPRPFDDNDRPNTAVDALREIEFDRATGKLSDGDYADLKLRYTKEALSELRAADRQERAAESVNVVNADAALDPVEAAIVRARHNQRSCTVCGPRPEPDATYCNSCGRYLPGCCATCGASVDLVGSRFCSGCGTQLAAA